MTRHRTLGDGVRGSADEAKGLSVICPYKVGIGVGHSGLARGLSVFCPYKVGIGLPGVAAVYR